MIKCEKLENDKYKTDFRGKLENLVDEFIALTEKFAEVVLNLDTMEMLDKLCQYYQEAKQNEANNEVKDEMTMDITKFLLYLGVRMQDLKNEEQETREAEEYAQADMCGARYDELKKVVDELKKIM
jgi:5'-deoxynucleotidase YfbR-like HD superfamily hydrolase|nr:MAG TPA: hypothetical protein [Caudoviricetes sp.]